MQYKARIMVVDDEPIVGKRLKTLLERSGYLVSNFTGGWPALDALGSEEFDLVVTDLKMKNIDGMKILDAAKEKVPCPAVIIITGIPNSEGAAEAFSRGASAFLAKPFKVDELIEVITRVMDARVPCPF